MKTHRFQKIIGLPEGITAKWAWVCSRHAAEYEQKAEWVYDPIELNELKKFIKMDGCENVEPICHECALLEGKTHLVTL